MDFDFDFSALSIAARVSKLARKVGAIDFDESNKFPSFAWPGAYTLIYFTRCGEILCGECMNDYDLAESNFGDSSSDRVIGAQTHDEGPAETCCNCNKDIPSSYGDPEDDEDPDINF